MLSLTLCLNMKTLIFLCLISFTFGTKIPGEFRNLEQDVPIGYGNLFKTMLIQSAQLTETNLNKGGANNCLKNALCTLGIENTKMEWPNLSVGNSLSNFYKMLTDMAEEIQANGKTDTDFPIIHQTVAR